MPPPAEGRNIPCSPADRRSWKICCCVTVAMVSYHSEWRLSRTYWLSVAAHFVQVVQSPLCSRLEVSDCLWPRPHQYHPRLLRLPERHIECQSQHRSIRLWFLRPHPRLRHLALLLGRAPRTLQWQAAKAVSRGRWRSHTCIHLPQSPCRHQCWSLPIPNLLMTLVLMPF